MQKVEKILYFLFWDNMKDFSKRPRIITIFFASTLRIIAVAHHRKSLCLKVKNNVESEGDS